MISVRREGRELTVCGARFVDPGLGPACCARKLNHRGICAGEAQALLAAAGVPLGADFHVLGSTQVEALVEAARRHGYHKARTASGSTARCFHDVMQRYAQDRVPRISS